MSASDLHRRNGEAPEPRILAVHPGSLRVSPSKACVARHGYMVREVKAYGVFRCDGDKMTLESVHVSETDAEREARGRSSGS